MKTKEFYVVMRFKGASDNGSEKHDVILDAGLFTSKEAASAECKKRAERLYEWAKAVGKHDTRIFEGSTKNWCVEYLEHEGDTWHEFWNYHTNPIYVNE